MKKGSYTNITYNKEVLGRAVRTHNDIKPIYISVGNGISINTATDIALKLTTKESHIPIPTRYADIETHIQREKYSRS